MTSAFPSAPGLPDHIWRPLHREDAAALHELELDCGSIDGSTSLSGVEDYLKRFDEAAENVETDTLCAVDSTGRLAAAAWVTCDARLKHEHRVFLNGRVHPGYRGRGLGSFILQWMEARGRQKLSELEEDRPGVLRIDFYDRSDDALALFEEHGFRFAFAEDEMRRDLSHPVPEANLPAGMTLVTWSAQRAARFFQTYRDAFRERPGFPDWSEETWRHNFTGGAGFRPDVSLLLLEDAQPVGFAICHVDTEAGSESGAEGWIAQMGVRPSWRNRGLGRALLREVLRRFQAHGLAKAALEVNVDNDRAVRLYERLGFERHRRRTSFQKAAHWVDVSRQVGRAAQ
jgi:mycothiol synthase